MAKFEYQAKDKTGQLRVGFIEDESRDGAASRLYADNLYVLTLVEVQKTGLQASILKLINKISQKDLMIFTRQFSVLLAAGVPLSESLRTLASQTQNYLLKETIIDVQKDIDGGLSLSQAMGKYDNVFTEFYTNMIRSAEVTGRVDEVMNFMADYLEKQAALMFKVKNALVYPVFMVVFLAVVVMFMAMVVFPQIESVFIELGAELPSLTKMIIDFGKFLMNWWWAVIAGFSVAVFALRDYFKSKEGKVLLDEIILRLPVFNIMFRNLYVARFADSISVLTRGGVPIVQALEITARTIGSAIYSDILKASADEMKNGVLLSQALNKYPRYFFPIVSQMIAVGESTGQVDALLQKISTFYAREVEDFAGSLTELIQPILMLVIGGVVGLLFASILTPMFNLVGTMLN